MTKEHEGSVARTKSALRPALESREKRRVLVDVDSVRLHGVNLDVLECLLAGGAEGMLLAIDQPACYTIHQLRLRGADTGKLWAVDLLTGVACPSPAATARLIVVNSPFTYDLPQRLREAGDRYHAARASSPGELGFLVVDNLAVLEYYVSVERLDLALRYVREMLVRGDPAKTVIPIDLGATGRAGRELREWGDVTVALREQAPMVGPAPPS